MIVSYKQTVENKRSWLGFMEGCFCMNFPYILYMSTEGRDGKIGGGRVLSVKLGIFATVMTYSCKCTQVIPKDIGLVTASFGWRLGLKCESRVFLALGGIVNVNVWAARVISEIFCDGTRKSYYLLCYLVRRL